MNYLFQLAADEKMTLVLDEYPYLRKNIRGLDSILQSLVDKYRDSSKLTIVILGSYVDVMRSLLEHSNPLFGRLDLVIDLKQMDYYESALFYPNYSEEDKIRIYSVFGGIPYFNRLIDDTKSVKENVIVLIASSGARLENEVSMFYFRYIFRYASQMKIMDADVFYKKYIEKDFEEQYVPHQFEEICKQYLIRMNKSGKINPVIEKIGKYYYDDPINHKNGEFDIVTEDERGYGFYEVKFKCNPLKRDEIMREIEQVKSTGINCYKYGFISRSGFEGEMQDNVEYIEIKDLYM